MSHADDLFSQPQVAGLAQGRVPSYLAQHRQRLRGRVLSRGADTLDDHELLEIILFAAIPRMDVKPLARRLLDRFGSFGAVVFAPAEALRREHGVGDAVVVQFGVIAAALRLATRDQLMNRPVISDWQAFTRYCRARIGYSQTETLRALYLDAQNALVADLEIAQGTIDRVSVYPREVFRHAFEFGATGVILVHNHPSGTATPSADDRKLTTSISKIGAQLGVTLHDHVVVSASEMFSFRAHKLL